MRLLSAEIDGFGQVLAIEHNGKQYKVRLPLVGAFQASNALVAAGLAIATQAIALNANQPAWQTIVVSVIAFSQLAHVLAIRSETESLFSLVKVATIVAFLLVGGLYAFGLWTGSEGSTVTNLWELGGFAPNGPIAVLGATVVVLFAFGGVEIITIAAGESAEPERGVASAITNVLWRIGLFYVASILVVVMVVPWNSTELDRSPFVVVMETVGVPGAALIMEVVVLIAVLSVLNAAMYTSSRMLFMLTRQGDAPGVLKGANRGRPLSAAGLDEIVRGARRRAGLEQLTCHQLRHTCFTRLREAGMALEVPRHVERVIATREPLHDILVELTECSERQLWLCRLKPTRG